MLTSEEQRLCLAASCLSLSFLVHPASFDRKAHGLDGVSSSACFHRLRDLAFPIASPEMSGCLSAGQAAALAEFERIYHSLPWQVIAAHPHISELPGDDLSPLVPAGERLLRLIDPASAATPSPNHALQRTAGGLLSFWSRLFSRRR